MGLKPIKNRYYKEPRREKTLSCLNVGRFNTFIETERQQIGFFKKIS